LVCPLNWGLGHASRDIQIIQNILKLKHNVIIAGSKNTNALLKTEFLNAEILDFDGFKIKYPKNKNYFLIYFLLRFPYFIYKIYEEHFKLKRIIKNKNIDVIISDNRYGLWSKKKYSVFITHQLFIKPPIKCKIADSILLKINKFFINKFDKCLVPDFSTETSISGELSHKKFFSNKVEFIGLLSKFYNYNIVDKQNVFDYEVTAIISGPEPYRTQFEEILLFQLKKTNCKCLILTGKPEEDNEKNIGNIKIVNHLSTDNMYNVINKSKYIVSRSGYSSIMDYVCLKKKAILVPTPGQTEQEYLADYFNKKNIFFSTTQNDFDILTSIESSEKYSNNFSFEKTDLLKNTLEVIFNEVSRQLNV